jgi:hypothetical protein
MPLSRDEGADAILPAGAGPSDQVDRQVAAGLEAGQQQGVVDAGVVAAADGSPISTPTEPEPCERRLRATALGW